MHGYRKKNTVILLFDHFEADLLSHSIKRLIQNYKLRPERLPARVAKAWYSTRGCESAAMSEDETKEWLRGLNEIKKSNLRFLNRCVKNLSSKKAATPTLRLRIDLAAKLMIALNDHRLLLAAQHNVGEAEMSLSAFVLTKQLTSRQMAAIAQIDFLAWVVEEILAAIQRP